VVEFVVFSVLVIGLIVLIFYSQYERENRNHFYRNASRATAQVSQQPAYRFKAKPDWVKKEVIQLKSMMQHKGCRKIAFEFNRQFKVSNNITVGKTYVANIIREHQYQIQVLNKKLKHKPPKLIPRQLIWGVDLTFKTDARKQTHAILGVIEHHSRKNLSLEALKDKATTTLLRYLFIAIEQYGKPKIIRTDNEGIFTSKLFTLSLWLLGIKHQTTDIHSPWQNGRVERFFGALKQKMNQWSVDSIESLSQDLAVFQFWYNNVRTHNNLSGKTPEEVWANISTHHYSSEKAFYFNEWDGLLSGFYHPP